MLLLNYEIDSMLEFEPTQVHCVLVMRSFADGHAATTQTRDI